MGQNGSSPTHTPIRAGTTQPSPRVYRGRNSHTFQGVLQFRLPSAPQRYNTLDFPGKVVCHETAGFFGFFRSKGNSIPSEHPRQRRTLFPFEIPLPTGMLLAPIGNPEPKEYAPLDTPPVRVAAIHPVHTRLLRSSRTGKTGTEICPDSGQISVPIFVQRRLSRADEEALQNPRPWLTIFALGCENQLSQASISDIIKKSNSLTGGHQYGHLLQ